MDIHSPAWAMNKQLWSPAYLLFTAGLCGSALCLLYGVCDLVRRESLM
jgi:predicted acyltransferase